MDKYSLYGIELIEDDSTLENFAKSLCKNLDIQYIGYCNYEDFASEAMDYVEESIKHDLSRTAIDYENLMYKYRNEFVDLLYIMENNGYELDKYQIHFFGEKAKESFETLLYIYINLHFTSIFK